MAGKGRTRGKGARKEPQRAPVAGSRLPGGGLDLITPGEHLCCFYRGKKEEYSITIPFFLAGLRNNEKCIYILDDSTREEVIQEFKTHEPKIEGYLRSKQLELLSSDETYLREGYFDPEKMVELLKQNEERALGEGYRGLRASGQMSWALRKSPGVERLVEYESRLNRFFPGSKTSAICLYDESKFEPKILHDIILVHPKIIIKGLVCKNHRYVPPDDFMAISQGKISRRIYERIRDDIYDREMAEIEHKKAEEALRESEERFRMLVETMNEGLCVLDEKGNITYVNERFCKMMGYSREELIGRRMIDFVDSEYVKVFEENFSREKKGEHRSYELVRIRKDGQKIHTITSAAPIFDPDGHFKGAFAVVTDITELKKMEQALRESEEKYRSLVEYSADSIYMLDRELRYLSVNEELLRRLGLPREKVLGRKFEELHTAEETKEFAAKAREVFETGRVVQQEHYHERLGRFFLRTISPVRDPKTGEVRAITVVGKDITPLKQAEEKLRKSEEEYRSLAENVADILLRIDLKGNCTYISKNVQEETGYTLEEVKKMNIKDILTPESYRTALNRIKMWQGGARSLPPYVVEVKLKDGRIVPFELKTSPIFENDELKGFQIVARNIAERVEATRALQQARAYAESIVETVHEPLLVLDAEMRVISANRAFYELFKVSPEETEKRSLYELGNRQWDIPELRRLLKDVVEKNASFQEYVVVHDFPLIGRRIMMLRARQMRTAAEEKPMILLAIEDVTERQMMETQLKRSIDIQTAIISLLSIPLKYSLEEILKRSLDVVLSISWLGFESRGAIFLFDEKQNALVLKAQRKLPEPLQRTCALVPVGKCLCGKAAATKKIIFADHVDENHETSYEGITPHGHYCVPILSDDKLMGVLNIYVKEGHRREETEEDFLKAIANALALIIARKNFEREQLEFIYRTNELSRGECYLHRSHRAAYNIAAQLMMLGVPGICFTREAPEKVMDAGIPKESIILISSVPLKGFETTDNLQEISMRISEFIKNNRESIVLLDGIEYLMSRFGFDMVYKFLQEKRFNFIDSDAVFLLPVDLAVFSERERALLASEIKIIG